MIIFLPYYENKTENIKPKGSLKFVFTVRVAGIVVPLFLVLVLVHVNAWQVNLFKFFHLFVLLLILENFVVIQDSVALVTVHP